MARISTSTSGGAVQIEDGSGNPLTSTGGALNVNAEIDNGFNTLGVSPTQISVGLTSTQLFAANTNRKYAHVSNNSGQTIYIQYQAAAVLNQGIKIPPNTLFTIESNNLWLGVINAIGMTPGQLIDILEGE